MSSSSRAEPQRDLALTFAGGGNRCFYQIGFWEPFADRLAPRLAAVAGVSAGACMLAIWIAGRLRESQIFFRARRGGVQRNLDWTALLRREPVAPHEGVYRDTVLFACEDGGFEKIRACPFPIYVLAAAFPERLSPRLGTLVGYGAYLLEKRLKPSMIHPSLGRRLGFRPLVRDARTCESPEELVDLILASSATPPFTPLGRLRGQPLIDGGLVDNVPAFVAEQLPEVRRNIVVMTRPYPREVLGAKGQRFYVAPAYMPPASVWDYRRDAPVDQALALGRAEAEALAEDVWTFVGEPPQT